MSTGEVSAVLCTLHFVQDVNVYGIIVEGNFAMNAYIFRRVQVPHHFFLLFICIYLLNYHVYSSCLSSIIFQLPFTFEYYGIFYEDTFYFIHLLYLSLIYSSIFQQLKCVYPSKSENMVCFHDGHAVSIIFIFWCYRNVLL